MSEKEGGLEGRATRYRVCEEREGDGSGVRRLDADGPLYIPVSRQVDVLLLHLLPEGRLLVLGRSVLSSGLLSSGDARSSSTLARLSAAGPAFDLSDSATLDEQSGDLEEESHQGLK